jgi:3-isopropylmalate dehydrogenase
VISSASPKSKLNIAVIPGDGIGPEVITQARRVLDVVAKKHSIQVQYEELPFSADEYLKSKRTLTDEDLARFRKEFDGILFGALGDPRVPDNIHAREILLGLRFRLDLYVNFRPVRLLHPSLCPLKEKAEKDVRFVIFRENTEGLYRDLGGQFRRDTIDEIAFETMLNTRKGVERILRAACEYAKLNSLKRVCMVDKSNALRHGHELWQRVWKLVQKDYVGLEFKHLYVDAAAMEIVRAPEQFDVIVTENMFGDILSDLGAQLQGGMGMAASVNYGSGAPALFEPVHGTAPNLKGKNVANPFAAILTVGLLLDYFGHPKAAQEIEGGVMQAIDKKVLPADLGGRAGTSEIGDYVVKALS